MHEQLIERLEAATGPSRELDAAIFHAIGAPVPFQFANKLIALEYNDVEQAYFAIVTDDMRVRYSPPNYTASIDAALTLVPEGWTCAFRQQDDGGWHAELREGYCTSYKRVVLSRSGKSPPPLPLAICISALRAKCQA